MTTKSVPNSPPRVAVLLASYNGEKYIEEQLHSIFEQRDVLVTVHVFDDCSTDGTLLILRQLQVTHSNLQVVENSKPSGSAFNNFYSAICAIETSAYDFVALSDQDDIWDAAKLRTQVSAMLRSSASGCSTSVTAFDMNGKRSYINNGGNQSELDYLFTGGGQGCTYLIERRSFEVLQQQIRILKPDTVPHDWLLYALARHQGCTWLILPDSLLHYRQHENAFGSRNGMRGMAFRLRMLFAGKFRRDRQTLVSYISDPRIPQPLVSPAATLHKVDHGAVARSKFALANLFRFRRTKPQSMVMALFFLLGLA